MKLQHCHIIIRLRIRREKASRHNYAQIDKKATQFNIDEEMMWVDIEKEVVW